MRNMAANDSDDSRLHGSSTSFHLTIKQEPSDEHELRRGRPFTPGETITMNDSDSDGDGELGEEAQLDGDMFMVNSPIHPLEQLTLPNADWRAPGVENAGEDIGLEQQSLFVTSPPVQPLSSHDTSATYHDEDVMAMNENGGAGDDDMNGPAGVLDNDFLAIQRRIAAQFQAGRVRPEDPISAAPTSLPTMERAKDAAAKHFAKLEAVYRSKKEAGTLSLEEEIGYMQDQQEERARLKKRKADQEWNQAVSDSDDGAIEVVAQPATKRVTKKRKTADGGIDIEAERETISTAEPKQVKAKRATAASGCNGRKRAPEKSRAIVEDESDAESEVDSRQQAIKAKEHKAALKAKNALKVTAERNKINANNMMQGGIFKDVKMTEGLAAQPELGDSTRRVDSMRKLLSSMTKANKKEMRSDKVALDHAVQQFTGQGSVSTTADGWKLKGMKCFLKHYQVMGASFMRQRELAGDEPRGGILADQMGLGKTIMSLANIINGKVMDKKSTEPRTTLVVATPALVRQWKEEIHKHADNKVENKLHGLGKVVIYRASREAEMTEPLDAHDVVLTTYFEVMASYPQADPPTELTTAEEKNQWWEEHFEENKGLLHRVKFRRIVLDEAQAIKNHLSRTSLACRALEGTFRWAISGTPIVNNLQEFYPYFKFLRVPETGSFRLFKKNFCTPDDPDGIERLNAFLRHIMIRRTHKDKMFDSRLLDLPHTNAQTHKVEFNAVERQIYETIRTRMIERINRMSSEGELKKNYKCIFDMMLRLRQICCHVLLVQEAFCDLMQREDLEKLNKICERVQDGDGEMLLRHLRNSFDRPVDEDGYNVAELNEDEEAQKAIEQTDMTGELTGRSFGKSFRFGPYLDSIVQSEHFGPICDRTICCGCRQPPREPQVLRCSHIYCYDCVEDSLHAAAQNGRNFAFCAECGEQFEYAHPCVEPSTDVTPPATATSAKKKEGQMKNWIDDKTGQVLPSAKTIALKAQILSWKDADPNVKVIIYTQWMGTVELLDRICQTESWGRIKYTGKMSHEARGKALDAFGKEGQNILIASLKCGGIGLNLTQASRVIVIDPWWNRAIEEQAFCRVFRIGQTKETQLTRFLVKNTIDESIEAMQERKCNEIGLVMSGSNYRPSMDELLRLFGNVGKDDKGNTFIYPSTSTNEDHPYVERPDRMNEYGSRGNDG